VIPARRVSPSPSAEGELGVGQAIESAARDAKETEMIGNDDFARRLREQIARVEAKRAGQRREAAFEPESASSDEAAWSDAEWEAWEAPE